MILTNRVHARLTRVFPRPIKTHCSPDGALVAFTVSEPDGHEEIYVVSVEGGRMRRLTRAGADFARVATWSEDGEVVYFVTSASRAFPDDDTLWRVPSRGGAPEKMTLGPVSDAQARPISHWFPYDRVGVVNADP